MLASIEILNEQLKSYNPRYVLGQHQRREVPETYSVPILLKRSKEAYPWNAYGYLFMSQEYVQIVGVVGSFIIRPSTWPLCQTYTYLTAVADEFTIGDDMTRIFYEIDDAVERLEKFRDRQQR
jgi:hypothetical protein